MTRPLFRLIAGLVFIHAAMTGMRMAAPLLALRDGHSVTSVGVLLALFALSPVFLALPAGRYADRHGLKRPVAWCVGLAMFGAGMALVWPVYGVLCVSALCLGATSGAAVIALQRHVGRAVHGATQLRQVFSWLAIGPAISNFLGPLGAGLMIDWAGAQPGSTTGYRAAFAMLALLPLLAWFCVRHTEELPAVASAAAGTRPRAWQLLEIVPFRRLLLVNWFLSSCWDVHTFAVPLLGHERGLSASVIGSILGAFAVAAAAVRVLIPILADRLSEWKVVMGAMLVAGMLFSVYPAMPTAWAMGLCSVLLGLALGSVQPMVMSMLHQFTPAPRHGEALGLRMMAINASSVGMPLLFGSAGAVVGVAGLFWGTALMVSLGSRMAWLLGRAPEAPLEPATPVAERPDSPGAITPDTPESAAHRARQD